MEHYAKSKSMEQTAKLFKISRATVAAWIKLQSETGSLAKRPLNRPLKKLNLANVKEFFDTHPDAFQREAAEHFGVCRRSIQDVLKKLKYTRKKNFSLQGAR
ncbi:transposase [Alphaproteobacteria bacterium]|nr:transposase [Alphaproteobacteria bacterium]